MNIDKNLLDNLTAQAKASPRLRMNYDLRTSAEDSSQRMLNAMEPGTVLPIHRHRGSTKTVVILRGKLRHNSDCLESGTVILECKDGKYEPLGVEDIFVT